MAGNPEQNTSGSEQNVGGTEQNTGRTERWSTMLSVNALSYSIVCFFEVNYGKGWYYIALYGTLWYPMSMVLFGECLLYVQNLYHYIEGAINM